MSDYITLADALAMHYVLIERYGGTHGVRDLGALESALFRPQTGYYTDVIAEAAALMESLAMNHPFLKGNKRTTFVVIHVFLGINGYIINANDETIHLQMTKWFEQGRPEFLEIERWLRQHVKTI